MAARTDGPPFPGMISMAAIAKAAASPIPERRAGRRNILAERAA
jgi:hypothetical protein